MGNEGFVIHKEVQQFFTFLIYLNIVTFELIAVCTNFRSSLGLLM